MSDFDSIIRSRAEGASRKNVRHRRRKQSWLHRLVDSYLAELELHAAEARYGITRIEAAAVDSFQLDMANITDSAERRQGIRDAALALGQLGVGGFKDIEALTHTHYLISGYGITASDIRALGEIKRKARAGL